MESKDIVIVGSGLVGQTLALKLSGDGHDVTLVESDVAKARKLSDVLDVNIVEGNGAIPRVLREANIEKASLVIACTDSDETNVVVGFVASSLFKVPHVVVRVRDPGHEETVRDTGDGMNHACVNSETAAVDHIDQLLGVPGALDVMDFVDGKLLVAAFRIGPESDFAGLRVIDMKLLFASTPTLVVAIHRGTEWLVPDGSEQIIAGDIVYFAIARHDLHNVITLVGVASDRRDRVMIAGAGSIGLTLARRLEARDVRVVLIEEDPARAERALEALGKTLVVRGPVTDQALLEEEEIERISTFVAVTGDHESNLVAFIPSNRMGSGRAITRVVKPAHVSQVGKIGVDAIISERLLTIGLTLQHIRGAGVRVGRALLEDQVEIMEVDAGRGSRLTSGPLMDIGLPRGVLVVAVRRGEEFFVPSGEDAVEPGDRVVVVIAEELAGRLSEFL